MKREVQAVWCLWFQLHPVQMILAHTRARVRAHTLTRTPAKGLCLPDSYSLTSNLHPCHGAHAPLLRLAEVSVVPRKQNPEFTAAFIIL